MLPTLVPNRQLALTLASMAMETNNLALARLAEEVSWAAGHYAVDNNRYPESAAYDAAACVAARLRHAAWLSDNLARFGHCAV